MAVAARKAAVPDVVVTEEEAAEAEFPSVDAQPRRVVTLDGTSDIPGDPTPVDPRDVALAALTATPIGAQPLVHDADGKVPAPLVRMPPRRTGERLDWAKDQAGDDYLVWASLYPRVIADNRLEARRGDVVRVPMDARTLQDIELGYLVAEEPPLI